MSGVLDAQVCGLSGIVALFFTGISHAHYSYYNVTPDAQARRQTPCRRPALQTPRFWHACVPCPSCAS